MVEELAAAESQAPSAGDISEVDSVNVTTEKGKVEVASDESEQKPQFVVHKDQNNEVVYGSKDQEKHESLDPDT